MTIEHVYDAADWTVTLGGVAIPWTHLEVSFQDFHTPATFHVEAPLSKVAIPTALKDKAPEVVVQRKGKDFFVGQADSSGAGGSEDTPEGMLSVSGRDLAARFVLTKIDSTNLPPMNLTGSQILTNWAKKLGLDPSGIHPTTSIVGDLIKAETIHITRNLDFYSVAFDLASYEGWVFRVKNRTVYFGPPPAIPATNTKELVYQRDFNRYEWRKNHANGDVSVRVMGKGKKGTKVSQTAGTGSILFERVLLDRIIDPGTAKAIADRDLAIIEAGLVTLDLTDLPGDHTLDDIVRGFSVKGIADGVDGAFYSLAIHHIFTQDDHSMDLHLYSKPAAANSLGLVAV